MNGNIASKLHQSFVFLFLRQQKHTATNESTNYTSHTMEPKLHNAQGISRGSQLHNAHRDVDVGRVAANKSDNCNPNHFNNSYFRNPKPYSFFGFTLYVIVILDYCFDHFITLFFDLNRLTLRTELTLCTTS